MHALVLFNKGLPDRAAPVSIKDFLPAGSCAGQCPSEYAPATWQADTCGDWACTRHADASLPGPVYLCGLCTSSLDIANSFARAELLPEWASVVTSAQSAGRGQLGRSWHSASGNLFAAVRLPLTPPFNAMEAAPAIGAYLVKTLRELGHEVWFKWPNDIVLLNSGVAQKLCGILLEERNAVLLAGIGINLVTPPPHEALRESTALSGGYLFQKTTHCGIIPLWKHLVSGLKFCYEQGPSVNGAKKSPWHSVAEQWLFHKGSPVTVLDGPHEAVTTRGIIIGLAPDGGLRLQTPQGPITVHSGSLLFG